MAKIPYDKYYRSMGLYFKTREITIKNLGDNILNKPNQLVSMGKAKLTKLQHSTIITITPLGV